ncbi:hypothetical protein BDZ45DRAFT_137429 [Acephala macrosclerotiorum]|nr:hypothetical protein BDZ45DRAFT_137429 [Acephala macrosclerotiorum]
MGLPNRNILFSFSWLFPPCSKVCRMLDQFLDYTCNFWRSKFPITASSKVILKLFILINLFAAALGGIRAQKKSFKGHTRASAATQLYWSQEFPRRTGFEVFTNFMVSSLFKAEIQRHVIWRNGVKWISVISFTAFLGFATFCSFKSFQLRVHRGVPDKLWNTLANS